MKQAFDINRHVQSRRLEHEVENRTAYTINNAELNIYETHHIAHKVELTFNDPVLASMIRGKKVMHLPDMPSFDFFPGESVIVSAGKTMKIDFPEATETNPTQCLALTICPSKIRQITDLLNEKQPIVDNNYNWQYGNDSFYFTNEAAIHQLIGRLVYVFTENNAAKDVFADLILQELIIRIMQTQARNMLTKEVMNHSGSHLQRLTYVTKFAFDNLHRNITIKELADKACMSEPNFFKVFKTQYGVSPIEYINQLRIKLAINLLQTTQYSISDICFACGFNNLNYFFKVFKKIVGTTPSNFKRNITVF